MMGYRDLGEITDETTVPVVYCKEQHCLEELSNFYGTTLTIMTDIGVREIFDDKTIQVRGRFLPGGDFYAHEILHKSTGVIREGSVDGFGSLTYFAYDIDEADHSRRISAIVCDDNDCGGYPGALRTDKQTEDIQDGKEITVTGREAACIPLSPITHCTEIGTATKISNPIVRGTGTIREIQPLEFGIDGVAYIIDLDSGGSVEAYVCESYDCPQQLEDALGWFHKTDFRNWAETAGKEKAGDRIRFLAEKLNSTEIYLHESKILKVVSCDEPQRVYDAAKAALKSSEKAEKAAGKRLASATKRAERRIATILKVQKIRLKRKEARKARLEKSVERLEAACESGNKRACRKLDRKKKNLAVLTAAIQKKKAKDAAKIASIEASLEDVQKAYEDAAAAANAAAEALEQARAQLDTCNS
jgi:exonuclease VII small subunit